MQIKRICEIGCTEDEFFGALNAKAESEQRRIVLMIDAANEGQGRLFWKNYINGFVRTITKYKWLGLALSVRSTYTKLLFPEDSVSEFVRYEHNVSQNRICDRIDTHSVSSVPSPLPPDNKP